MHVIRHPRSASEPHSSAARADRELARSCDFAGSVPTEAMSKVDLRERTAIQIERPSREAKTKIKQAVQKELAV